VFEASSEAWTHARGDCGGGSGALLGEVDPQHEEVGEVEICGRRDVGPRVGQDGLVEPERASRSRSSGAKNTS
jgi:hypothetical protein